MPLSRKEMEERGWKECDFILVSGDAYVDHPSFAAALISRVLEAGGFRVGIIPQPDWKNPASYTVLGRPRLAFLVGAGNMDSMVAHYTAAKRRRREDAFSPGGISGLRPDRALLVYVEGIRRAYKEAAVIIGGIEASLRRFAHYDYWSDKVRRSILLDSKADVLVYGMGESAILEIAQRLNAGEKISDINDVRGTCIRSNCRPKNALELPCFESVNSRESASLRSYAEHFMIQKMNADPLSAKILAEKNDSGRWLIQNPPALALEQKELDRIYELPFTKRSHPIYDKAGGIPALKEVSFSMVSSRGCSGGCSFCSIALHQGRTIRGRSLESLVREAKELTNMSGYKGYINDLGGPTANFHVPLCKRQEKGGFCPERECLFPLPCPEIKANHGPYLDTLNALRRLKGIKKVFIRSGLRFDFINSDLAKGREFLEALCKYHVSGQLKVATEHSSPKVLSAMGKNGDYGHFCKQFFDINKRLGLKQYIIPYYISGHPGSSLEDAVQMALSLKKSGFIPDQVQDFYPTPGTLSTVMYYTGLDPRAFEPIHVPKGREKKLQKALFHYNKRENSSLVREALKQAGREDLYDVLTAR